MFWWWLATLTVGVQLVVLVVNTFTFPVLVPAQRAGTRRVSLLIPARNEGQNLPETLPLALAQGADEVLVLDDASEDDTAEVIASLPGVRGLMGEPLPPGWVGRGWTTPWALQGRSSRRWRNSAAPRHGGRVDPAPFPAPREFASRDYPVSGRG